MELTLLDPVTDHEWYKLAYSWRRRQNEDDRMSFADFSSTTLPQLTFAYFRPCRSELVAIYLYCEVERGIFDCHATAPRGTPRPTLLSGAWVSLNRMREVGAQGFTAWVKPRHKPLRKFVEELGFRNEGVIVFPCKQVDTEYTLPTPSIEGRAFVKYVA